MCVYFNEALNSLYIFINFVYVFSTIWSLIKVNFCTKVGIFCAPNYYCYSFVFTPRTFYSISIIYTYTHTYMRMCIYLLDLCR